MKTITVSEKTHTQLKSILRKDETLEDAIRLMIFAYEHPRDYMQLDKPLHIRHHVNPRFTDEEKQAIISFLVGKNER